MRDRTGFVFWTKWRQARSLSSSARGGASSCTRRIWTSPRSKRGFGTTAISSGRQNLSYLHDRRPTRRRLCAWKSGGFQGVGVPDRDSTLWEIMSDLEMSRESLEEAGVVGFYGYTGIDAEGLPVSWKLDRALFKVPGREFRKAAQEGRQRHANRPWNCQGCCNSSIIERRMVQLPGYG